MIMRRRPLLAISALLALSACAERPFVDTAFIDIRENRSLNVCYSEDSATLEEATALAQKTCGELNMNAKLVRTRDFTCRLNAPKQATYRCIPR